MNEAYKTKQLWGDFEKKIISSGQGIDIGCGNDPINEKVRKFDKKYGDTNEITKYVKEQFDFVFSCHCLEHTKNPKKALQEWWKLVKPGGYMIIIVPDQDLYEQGYFPSLFNYDHKFTFTISKEGSWSKKSYNVMDFINFLDNSVLQQIKLQDKNYKKHLLHHPIYPRILALAASKIRRILIIIFEKIGFNLKLYFPFTLFKLPIDQTLNNAMAQIEIVIKKNNENSNIKNN